MRIGVSLFLLNILFLGNLFAQSNIREIYPTDDTYVFARGDNDPSVIRGLDDMTFLKTYFSAARKWTNEAYLKFDLSSISSNPEMIENVELKLYGNDTNGKSHIIALYKVEGSDWDEDNLNWETISRVGDKSKITSIEQNMGKAQWHSWNITNLIKTEKAKGSNILALMLCDETDVKIGKNSIIMHFHSKENPSGYKPHLKVKEQDISDLVLSGISIDGKELDLFDPFRFNYTIEMKEGENINPKLKAIAKDRKVKVEISNQSKEKNENTALIKLSKGERSIAYQLSFRGISSDANAKLRSILVNGEAVEFFYQDSVGYKYYLPYTYRASDLPVITYQKNNPNQQVSITAPSGLTGTEAQRTATISVASGDKSQNKNYKICFEILPELDLYLCIGQSNMAGRGPIDESKGDLKMIEGTYLLTPRLRFEPAQNPLNKYSSRRKELSAQKISPAYGFLLHMNEKTNQNIGLIVNARGGSGMTEWLKGNAGLYESALLRAQEAMKWGKLRAILWHQGESDMSDANRALYEERLSKMITDFRKDLNSPNLLFIAGELGMWRDTDTKKTYEEFNNNLRRTLEKIPYSGCASAKDLKPYNEDIRDPHFDRDGNIELGLRYAEEVLEHQKEKGL